MEADLQGILSLLRRHIEIRNRSWMKRIHRDCFIGSEAVDFLVTQGLADTREIAVNLCRKMAAKDMIKKVTDTQKNFSDSYHYYRFKEDDVVGSALGDSNAGNSNGTATGQGGCKWSFAPHTAHNSYVLDIGLAEELERAVAGASVEARLHALKKLRARVKEQAEPDAPDWLLSQSTEVNNTKISVFQRKRPRGDWMNVKMTGMAGESPVGFIKGIMSFNKRKQWEGMFEDGVIVEGIETGEAPSALLTEDTEENTLLGTTLPVDEASGVTPKLTSDGAATAVNVVRKTDDVNTFLQTVDLAGVPQGMAIAFLNDPERQHALAHLRKQMMLSNPQECMLCKGFFDSSADVRCCPCCAMVSCASCVCKRVFEVISRQVVSVCVHCYRESSRIRQPPQVVTNTLGIKESVKGKWWRPEDLGIVDYSQQSLANSSSVMDALIGNNNNAAVGAKSTNRLQSVGGPTSLYNDQDVLVLTSDIVPLVPGLLDGLEVNGEGRNSPFPAFPALSRRNTEVPYDENAGVSDVAGIDDFDEGNLGTMTLNNTNNSNNTTLQRSDTLTGNDQFVPSSSPMPGSYVAGAMAGAAAPSASSSQPKTARCKRCGLLISRSMEAIEAHMEECGSVNSPHGRNASIVNNEKSYTLNGPDGSTITIGHGLSKSFGGITRRPELENFGTRIIYRTARKQSGKAVRPREVCALQDSFIDEDGICYVYEISVRHCDVLGLPDYVTADVMLLLHVAQPVKGSKNMSNITIISQVNTHSRSPQWLLAFTGEQGSRALGRLHKDDLVRELTTTGNLQNILKQEQQAADGGENAVTLEDFDLLAVLGRGGFGKVMQVRHRTTDTVYAMKILKKSELRRRKQVERTQTERTILANVRHPFIVCLHYAFQSPQKLYMVMDFVQGGDFFTLMRKFKRIPEDWVRLYVIEVAMALQHLHDMDVVYRDLKPENILLCGDGHLKLTDFGLSRFFETRPPAPEDMLADDNILTRSFCGTEQYMSPEMLLQQGHNFRMDWWCLGLLMHEMISARHPFHGPSHYDTLRNMVTKPPTIDPRLSAGASAVVKHFLIKNPRTRLCCKDGTAEMRNLPYFGIIDWDALYAGRIEMPYKPKLVGETDVSSFETTFTRERPVDSNPDAEGGEGVKRKSGKGGLLGLFGYGKDTQAANAKSEQQADNDAFKGFSFAKEENAAIGTSAGNHTADSAGQSVNNHVNGTLPVPPSPARPVSSLTAALNKT